MTTRPAGADGRAPLLGIETATSETIVALQPERGGPVVAHRWPAGRSHGERLLAAIEQVLGGAGIRLDEVAAIAVGTGPGSFTGLRIGLAVAKGLAFGRAIPLVGVSTAEVIARTTARGERVIVLQPAGPSGRYRTVVERDAGGRWQAGASEMLSGGQGHGAADPVDGMPIAVDLPDADAAPWDIGRSARARLPEALIEAARERLAADGPADVAELVPAYVSPPRGAVATNGMIEWSRARP